jgi:hypothetical protein
VEQLLEFSRVQAVRTGSDGGHIYLKGYGLVPGRGECDIYVFSAREEEARFEAEFRGRDLTIATHSVEFVRGMGAYVNNCRVVEKNDAP